MSETMQFMSTLYSGVSVFLGKITDILNWNLVLSPINYVLLFVLGVLNLSLMTGNLITVAKHIETLLETRLDHYYTTRCDHNVMTACCW